MHQAPLRRQSQRHPWTQDATHDANMGEPLVPGLLHCEGASCQSATPSLAATMADVRARMSRAVRARASTADGQTETSSACWHIRKRASLGTGSSANSLVGLGPQYVRAGVGFPRRWTDSSSRFVCLHVL